MQNLCLGVQTEVLGVNTVEGLVDLPERLLHQTVVPASHLELAGSQPLVVVPSATGRPYLLRWKATLFQEDHLMQSFHGEFAVLRMGVAAKEFCGQMYSKKMLRFKCPDLQFTRWGRVCQDGGGSAAAHHKGLRGHAPSTFGHYKECLAEQRSA